MMSQKRKPIGSVKVVNITPSKPHHIGVFGTVVCEDEKGVQWQFSAASMVSDLRPYNPYPQFKLRKVSALLEKKASIKIGDTVLVTENSDRIRPPDKYHNWTLYHWAVGTVYEIQKEIGGIFINRIGDSPGWRGTRYVYAQVIDPSMAQKIIQSLLLIEEEDDYFNIEVCKLMHQLGLTEEGEE